MNGMVTFDEDGIQALTEAVNDDLTGTYDRLQAMQDYADEGEPFGGVAEGKTCAVKYIFKTEEIGKQ